MRGSNEFTVMKGFMDDFTVKGDGHELETVPVEEGEDVTETAELDAAGVAPTAENIKPVDNKTGAPSTTMDPELAEVQDKAEEDIAEGFVADSQHLPGPGTRAVKGYEAFNELVAKGVVVSVPEFNKYDIDGSFEAITKSADLSFNVYAENLSPWLSGNDMTIFKGASALDIIRKGDPEDMSLEDGYTEDPDEGNLEEAADDTKSVEGENKEDPQTTEAETQADKGDSSTPAKLSDEDGTENGEKTEDVTKGPSSLGRAIARDWRRSGKDAGQGVLSRIGSAAKVGTSGAYRQTKRAAKRGYKYVKENPKEAAKTTAKKVGKYGAVGGAGYYAGSRKGFDDYNSGIATKGFEVEEKSALGTVYRMERSLGAGRMRSALRAGKAGAKAAGHIAKKKTGEGYKYVKENPKEAAKTTAKKVGKYGAVGGAGYYAGSKKRNK